MDAKDKLVSLKDLRISDLDEDMSKISDKQLYCLSQQCGQSIKTLRRIFAVLLVEIDRRKLCKRYGFESIFEFAAKVGGMNRELVSQILYLARKLQDKPFLWRQFRNFGWSKLRVVAAVATNETDQLWAEKVRTLSKPVLEVYVKEWRKVQVGGLSGEKAKINVGENETHFSFPENNAKNAVLPFNKPRIDFGEYLGERNLADCCTFANQKMVRMSFKVTEEVEFRLRVIKQNLEKRQKEALSFGEVLRILLKRVDN